MEARIALLEPHTLRWYVNKAKAFMWDQTGTVKLQLKQDTDVYDLSSLSDTSEEALAKYRPVKYAVATEDNTIIYIKVAREDEKTQNPVKLTDGMLNGLRSYLNEIKDAGVSVVVRNEDADQMQVRFQQAVLELPLKQRLVFNLRYYDGMSYGQIARVLGQREQTLKVNYHYAVQKLKEKLTQEI